MSYVHLMSPIKVAGKTYKNRMIASPALAGLIMPDGAFPEDQYRHYEQKAAGGCASVTIGETEVNFVYGNKSAFPPPTDYRDFQSRQFREWCRHASMIHSHGALALVQLCQSGNLRQKSMYCEGPGYGPDAMTAFDGTEIRAMTEEIMADTVESWCLAAKYMKAAGFDGVNLHFGHSWLPHQFLSPRSNHRTDEYGGSAKNRRHFPLRILKALREAVGSDFILELRISGSERCEGGMTMEEVGDFCVEAEPYVDIIHVSAGVYRDPTTNRMDGPASPMATGMYPSMYRPNISNLEEASYIKRRVNIPICIVGGIRNPADADRIIAEGLVDMVAMGRQVNKADPNFANKVTADDCDEIDQCIRCGICMGGTAITLRKKDKQTLALKQKENAPQTGGDDYYKFEGPRTKKIPADADFYRVFSNSPKQGAVPDYCSVNPYHDRGDMMPDGSLPRTRVKKKILVIGGGMAGMQAAITAADIGFDVVLCEQSASLGGIFRFADHDEHKYDLKQFKDRLIRRIAKRCWIDLRTNTKVDAALIAEVKPDFIICAIGSSQAKPPIVGLENAKPLLEAYGDDVKGKRVVLLGGGLSACESALSFASRGAADVVIVARRNELALGPLDSHKMDLFRLYKQYPIRPYLSAAIERIMPGKVLLQCPDGPVELEADEIIYALGMQSNPSDMLRKAAGSIPFELAGDCVEPTKVYHAIYDGATAALNAYHLFNRTNET